MAVNPKYYKIHTDGCDIALEPIYTELVPVVHGRWVDADDGDGVVCSVCGEDFCTIIHETDRFKFCPNCGARMDGEG